ncbi:MAG: hypothetical protein WBD67_09365 [Terracidiphilus sp.]
MSRGMWKGEKMLPERELQKLEPQKTDSEYENALGPELRQALDHFKASVHGWSAALENQALENQALENRAKESQSRAVRPARHKLLRLAAGWALASLMVAAAVSGVVYEKHQKQELAQMEHQRLLEQQQQMAEQHRKAEEDLLAKVETDISREVPSAMEPLAQLMTGDGTQTANAAQ